MDTVEVKLLNYTFKFKRLRWREEFAIKFPPKKDPIRVVLAYAMLEVSGLVPKTIEEAQKVIDSIPSAIVSRVWKLYKAGFPPSQRFITVNLYKAPETHVFMERLQEENEGDAATTAHNTAMNAMESKFGTDDIQTTREHDRAIFEAAKKRGSLVKASE